MITKTKLMPAKTRDDHDDMPTFDDHQSELVSDRVRTTMTNLSYLCSRNLTCGHQDDVPVVGQRQQHVNSAKRRSRFCVGKSSLQVFLLFLTVVVIPYEKNLSFATSAPQQGASSHHLQVPTSPIVPSQQIVSPTTTLANSSAPATPTAATATTTSRANATAEQLLLNLVKNNFKQQQSANGSRLPAAFAHSRPGQKYDHVHHPPNTKFACEGNRLELSCQEGKTIHLVRANYGRFSLSICNELNHVNLNNHCTEWRAFLIMQTRCDKLSNCTVDVSKELFGDPCEGTSKYLEVQYYCDDVNSNQQQHTLTSPNRPANQPAAGGDQVAAPGGQASGNKSPSPSVGQQHQQQQVGGQQPQQQQATEFPPLGEPSGAEADVSAAATAAGSTVIQQFCMAQTSARNLFWNHTLAGHVARRTCPDGSTGKTTWRCDPQTLRFSPAWSPDFTRCKSNWLQRLAHQLDQMLEAPGNKQPGAEWMRQQNEQILKVILADLALMAKTKELFSEDLKRIDIMLGQIIAQMRSLSVLFARGYDQQQPSYNNQLTPMYEELFSKMVAIVSSLFDVQQRSAWLEVQPNESRRYLELRFLDHLKESGAMLAYVAGPWAAEQQPLRQPNVLAGITVIPGLVPGSQQQPASITGRLRELVYNTNQQLETNEFNLQPLAATKQQISSRFNPMDDPAVDDQQQQQQINDEFRIQLSTLQPLIANGITRFLVLDVKKPDYALIRQQLETAYGSQLADTSNLATGDQQWNSRVFGVFGINGERGDVVDGHANNQQEQKLVEVLAESPISIDFKVSSSLVAGQMQAPPRQCNSLSDNLNLPDRCQTHRFNATNHICRCTQFGFVALSAAPSQVPNTIGQNVNMGPWPQLPGSPNSIDFMEDSMSQQATAFGAGASSRRGVGDVPPTFIGAQKQQPSQQQSVGFWTTIFIVFGLSLLVVSLAAFVIQTIVRINSQSRLNKKQGFLAAGSILGHNTARDLSGGPTTGPLSADHGLMGQASLTGSPATGTNHSASIIGLTQSACHGYKTHQQLYAAHYPAIEPCNAVANKWRSLTNWLRPSRWLAAGRDKSVDHLGVIQHRVIGSTIGGRPIGSACKSQFQNGYTTSLHHPHNHQSAATSQLPLAAPSSSTSSYVSSSAYYEEIGPGNLTKVNTCQLANGQRHTIVEPFKRPPTDQQQLLNESNHLHNHHQHQQSGWTTINQQHLGGYDQRSIQASKQQQHLHNDLSHLHQNPSQSSGSSGSSSQHSASTNMTSVNGGAQTPRHYLFASPQAVSAYESSLNQLTLHSNHQSTLATQQQYFNHQQRFMPSG